MKTQTNESLIKFEENLVGLFKDGKISCPIHISGGNEDELCSIFELVNNADWIVSSHRNHYHYLLKGGKEQDLLWEIMGDKKGICGGRGRSMHIFDKSINFISSAIVAGGPAIAVGIALGIKHRFKGRKTRPMVWCFVGDGAEDSGHFMEAVRFGHSRDLPLTFVIEDNDLAVESSKRDRWHNYIPIKAPNIIRYEYQRQYPHVGIGEHVSM